MPQLDFPYHFDGTGRTAGAPDADHIRDLIEQVLLTSPGERVMRPDFGTGLLALVFEPNSSTRAATTQFLVQTALQQHLSHLITVQDISVEPSDSVLQVTLRYAVLSDQSVRASVDSYLVLARPGVRLNGVGVDVPTGSPDGVTAEVTLVATARIPLFSFAVARWSNGVPLRATARARARADP